MGRKPLAVAAGLGALLLATSAAHAVPVLLFTDSFDAGDRNNITPGNYVWYFTSAEAVQSNGSLHFTGAVHQLRASSVAPEINFFTQPIMYSVREIAYTTAIGGDPDPTGTSTMYMGVNSTTSSNFGSNDSISWQIIYNGTTDTTTLRMASKLNEATNYHPYWNPRLAVTRTGRIEGFDLELSPTGFSWTVLGPAMAEGSETFTDTWLHAPGGATASDPFTLADWNQAGGAAHLRNEYSSSGTIVMSIGELSISQVPEPVALGLLGLTGLALLRRRTR